MGKKKLVCPTCGKKEVHIEQQGMSVMIDALAGKIPGPNPNHCCYCGRELTEEEMKKNPTADPFAEEIYGNDDKHLICDYCYGEHCMDI